MLSVNTRITLELAAVAVITVPSIVWVEPWWSQRAAAAEAAETTRSKLAAMAVAVEQSASMALMVGVLQTLEVSEQLIQPEALEEQPRKQVRDLVSQQMVSCCRVEPVEPIVQR